jgi:hypothetical protein
VDDGVCVPFGLLEDVETAELEYPDGTEKFKLVKPVNPQTGDYSPVGDLYQTVQGTQS